MPIEELIIRQPNRVGNVKPKILQLTPGTAVIELLFDYVPAGSLIKVDSECADFISGRLVLCTYSANVEISREEHEASFYMPFHVLSGKATLTLNISSPRPRFMVFSRLILPPYVS